MANRIKYYSKDDILRSMRHTKSILAAARYLGCNYKHVQKYFKMYTDEETGKTLFDIHKNASGKGIFKFSSYKNKNADLEAIITGKLDPANKYSVNEIKERLIFENYLAEECNICGFNEHRVKDYKVPLLLSFKDGNKKYFNFNNLELLCYNCYFLRVGNIPLANIDISVADDKKNIKEEEIQPEILDSSFDENMKALGINI